jgi:hypothetical protein
MSKSAVAALVPPAANSVEVDRTLDAPPAQLASVIGELMGVMKNSLPAMDDISLEVSAHSDQARSSVRVAFRGYRRADRRDSDDAS